MSELTLSVVLCTYNGEKYLSHQLDSLLSQTRLPDEIVVGDDASTDGSWALLQDFAVRARQTGIAVRLERNVTNRGYIANFSDSLRRAAGDLLFLCDQDDIWASWKLARMEAAFREDPGLLLLSGNAKLVNSQGGDLGENLFDALELTSREIAAIHGNRAFDVLIRRSLVTGSTAGFRRGLVESSLPVGKGWVHDEWFALVAASLGRVDVLDAELIDYRQHGANQIGMRKRGVKRKWHDLTCSRSLQFRAELDRLIVLERHLRALQGQVPDSKLELVTRRRDHFAKREAIGREPRLRRLATIIEEARQGNYAAFGTGTRSMLRDLMRHD